VAHIPARAADVTRAPGRGLLISEARAPTPAGAPALVGPRSRGRSFLLDPRLSLAVFPSRGSSYYRPTTTAATTATTTTMTMTTTTTTTTSSTPLAPDRCPQRRQRHCPNGGKSLEISSGPQPSSSRPLLFPRWASRLATPIHLRSIDRMADSVSNDSHSDRR
jgi:hypothetical protein